MNLVSQGNKFKGSEVYMMGQCFLGGFGEGRGGVFFENLNLFSVVLPFSLERIPTRSLSNLFAQIQLYQSLLWHLLHSNSRVFIKLE